MTKLQEAARQMLNNLHLDPNNDLGFRNTVWKDLFDSLVDELDQSGSLTQADSVAARLGGHEAKLECGLTPEEEEIRQIELETRRHPDKVASTIAEVRSKKLLPAHCPWLSTRTPRQVTTDGKGRACLIATVPTLNDEEKEIARRVWKATGRAVDVAETVGLATRIDALMVIRSLGFVIKRSAQGFKRHDDELWAAVIADVEAGLTCKEAGDKHGISHHTVLRFCQDAGLPTRFYSHNNRANREDEPVGPDWELCERLVGDGVPYSEAARQCGLSEFQVAQKARECGWPPSAFEMTRRNTI